MAKEVIHACRGAEHNSVDVEGVTHYALGINLVKSEDPGDAGEPGTVETVVTHRDVRPMIYGQDFEALLALVEATAADLVVKFKGAGGVNKKTTIKSVYFDEVPQEIAAKAKDAGGKVSIFAIRGTAQWGASDTLATMIVTANDV